MKINTSTLVKAGILGAIGYVLMFIAAPLPMLFPEFLRLDISDITGVLGGIALGPLAGVMIVFIKNLLQFFTGMSTTSGIGEFANFLIGGSFIVIVSYIYKKKRNLKVAIIGLLCGVIVMTIVGCISNYFILLPFYSTIMPMEAVINMGTSINPKIVDKLSFVFLIIAPFNLLKGIIISLLTLTLYKRTEIILNKR